MTVDEIIAYVDATTDEVDRGDLLERLGYVILQERAILAGALTAGFVAGLDVALTAVVDDHRAEVARLDALSPLTEVQLATIEG